MRREYIMVFQCLSILQRREDVYDRGLRLIW